MKYILVLLGIYLPASIAGNSVSTGACFFRYEDNGILNVRPAYISVDGKKVAMLEGGGIQCVALTVGHHNVYAYSSDPYDPHDKNENAWRSNDLSVDVATNALRYIRVIPKSEHAAYTGPWQVLIAPKAPNLDSPTE